MEAATATEVSILQKSELQQPHSPERILEEAVERNEQSISRIQSRIQQLEAALDQLAVRSLGRGGWPTEPQR
jgi:hypothetical protein